jgi:hypothetical protein
MFFDSASITPMQKNLWKRVDACGKSVSENLAICRKDEPSSGTMRDCARDDTADRREMVPTGANRA